MLDVFAPRSAGDILSRSVRLVLGDTEYALPVLFIAGNERWKAAIDAKFNGVVTRLDEAGNDTARILAALGDQPDDLLDLIYSYDTDEGRREGVLPDREDLKESVYEGDLLAAVREVWRAANPLVVMRIEAAARDLVEATAARTTSESSPPTSSSPTPTAGPSNGSAGH
jgi:hypothetical protein